MQTLIARIQPCSAFGGRIRGDTLFGQLCWAARHRFGQERLGKLLDGYLSGEPFAIVSDAFPAGYIPRPALPLHRYKAIADEDRKRVKKLVWVPIEAIEEPVTNWLKFARSEKELLTDAAATVPNDTSLWAEHNQSHNSINRLTGTTGTGEFAPYASARFWPLPGMPFDIYLAIDDSRLDVEELRALLGDIGTSGYGRDVTIGLGKFDLLDLTPSDWPNQANANAALTLAPCAIQDGGFEPARSWYQPFTRFGRHGDLAVHSGRPFKTPVLMADTGALLSLKGTGNRFHAGKGLGGDGSLSKAAGYEGTVHQGYAPVLRVYMEEQQ